MIHSPPAGELLSFFATPINSLDLAIKYRIKQTAIKLERSETTDEAFFPVGTRKSEPFCSSLANTCNQRTRHHSRGASPSELVWEHSANSGLCLDMFTGLCRGRLPQVPQTVAQIQRWVWFPKDNAVSFVVSVRTCRVHNNINQALRFSNLVHVGDTDLDSDTSH